MDRVFCWQTESCLVFCTDVMLYWNHHKEYARDKLDDRTATYPWDKVLRLE